MRTIVDLLSAICPVTILSKPQRSNPAARGPSSRRVTILCTPDDILDVLIFPGIRRLYPTYPIEYHFLGQLDASKKVGQEKLERAREVEVAQHLTPAKGTSPTP